MKQSKAPLSLLAMRRCWAAVDIPGRPPPGRPTLRSSPRPGKTRLGSGVGLVPRAFAACPLLTKRYLGPLRAFAPLPAGKTSCGTLQRLKTCRLGPCVEAWRWFKWTGRATVETPLTTRGVHHLCRARLACNSFDGKRADSRPAGFD